VRAVALAVAGHVDRMPLDGIERLGRLPRVERPAEQPGKRGGDRKPRDVDNKPNDKQNLLIRRVFSSDVFDNSTPVRMTTQVVGALFFCWKKYMVVQSQTPLSMRTFLRFLKHIYANAILFFTSSMTKPKARYDNIGVIRQAARPLCRGG